MTATILRFPVRAPEPEPRRDLRPAVAAWLTIGILAAVGWLVILTYAVARLS